MKKFLYTILRGLFLIILILLIIESLIIPNIENEYSYKYNYVNTHSDDVSILLVGNSYFENSINPNLIGDSCFDFASSGRWITYDKQLVEDIIPNMSNLRVVIFPMGYKWPFVDYDKNPNQVVDFYHQKYMHVWYDCFPKNIDRWFAIRHSNRIGFKKWSNQCNHNWKGEFLLEGHLNNNWKEHNNISPEIINTPDVEQNIATYKYNLLAMAEICMRNNIRFIVITPPCHDSYNQNVRAEGIERLYTMINDLKTIAPIEYENYLFDSEYRADSLYYDSSHLNKVGANKFSLRLKNDFKL